MRMKMDLPALMAVVGVALFLSIAFYILVWRTG
jgi:hypothetical protein